MKTVFAVMRYFFFYLLFYSNYSQAQFSASSILTGSVTTTSVAQGVDWSNPVNVTGADNTFATSLITGSNKPTFYLDAKNWGFQTTNTALANYVPSDAVINGIEVFVKMRKSGSGSIRDNKIILLKAGAESGSSKARGNTLWPATAAEVRFGGSTDVWGGAWTASDLINSGFGIRISAKNRGSKDAQAEIDYIHINVYFNQVFYYSKSTGNLELLTTWGRNTDGSGANPAAFTTSGQVFFLQNRTSAALTANLTISGTNSKMIIGDGTNATSLTIPSAYALASIVDVSSPSSLTINSTTNPTLGIIADNTTVTYGASGDQNVQDATYFNLTLSGSGNRLLQNLTSAITTVNNVFTIGPGISFNNSGNTINVYGTANGLSNNGTETGAGRIVYSLQDISTGISGTGTYSNLEIALSTTGSARTLTLSNPTSITGTLYLTDGILANSTNLTMAAGSAIELADGSVASAVMGTGYDLIYDPYTSVSPKTTSNELSSGIRHFTLQTGNGLTLALNRNLVLSGNLILTSGTMDPTGANYSISIGGNYTNNASMVFRNNTVNFNGSSAQSISASTPSSFYDLTMNNSYGGVQANTPITVTHGLTLTNGLLTTSSSNLLVIANGASISGGSAASYINGPVQDVLAATTGNLFFPVGKNGVYRPASLSVSQISGSSTSYTAELFTGAPSSRTLPSTLGAVSSVRYWNISCSNGANLSSANVTLSYGPDDDVTDPLNLRIAKSNGLNWADIGGTGTAAGSGTITSSSFFGFSDFVLASIPVIILPVRWISFTAVRVHNETRLDWKTTDESDGDHLEVERSTDGSNWETIASLPAKNKAVNDYSYIDYTTGARFYRALLADKKGQRSYSNIAALNTREKAGIRIEQPSPTQLRCFIDDLRLTDSHQMKIVLTDMKGNVLLNENHKPERIFYLSLPKIPGGVYVLTLYASDLQLRQTFFAGN